MPWYVQTELAPRLIGRFIYQTLPQATEKLSEGIRNFAKDTLKLEADIKARIAAL
jgi:hypothetical protein